MKIFLHTLCLLLLMNYRDISSGSISDREKHELLIFAHRGNSGMYPESSFLSYEGVSEGHYLECDLQLTSDEVFICSHEVYLNDFLTNIEDSKFRASFPIEDKHAEIIESIEGFNTVSVSGWFIPDYSWDKIKQLGLKQRIDQRNHDYDFKTGFVTLEKLIEIAIKSNFGIYIESKNAHWYRYSRGIDIPQLMVKQICFLRFCNFANSNYFHQNLRKAPLNQVIAASATPPCPIYFQSFEIDDLLFWFSIGLANVIPITALLQVPLDGKLAVYGETYSKIKDCDMLHNRSTTTTTTPQSLHLYPCPITLELMKSLNITALGLDREIILKNNLIINQIHSHQMEVHVWTLDQKIENPLTTGYDTLQLLHELNVDGIFCDFPTQCVHTLMDFSKGSTSHRCFLRK